MAIALFFSSFFSPPFIYFGLLSAGRTGQETGHQQERIRFRYKNTSNVLQVADTKIFRSATLLPFCPGLTVPN
jgi:hypothetical protein